MSDDVIIFTGPVDAPPGLILPKDPIPVTLAHDWTRPLAVAATITPDAARQPTAVLRGNLATDVLAWLQSGDAVLAGAWADTCLLGVSVILAPNKPLTTISG